MDWRGLVTSPVFGVGLVMVLTPVVAAWWRKRALNTGGAGERIGLARQRGADGVPDLMALMQDNETTPVLIEIVRALQAAGPAAQVAVVPLLDAVLQSDKLRSGPATREIMGEILLLLDHLREHAAGSVPRLIHALSEPRGFFSPYGSREHERFLRDCLVRIGPAAVPLLTEAAQNPKLAARVEDIINHIRGEGGR